MRDFDLIKEFLVPVSDTLIADSEQLSPYQLGNVMQIHHKDFPDLEDVKIAIVGVGEHRNAFKNDGCELAPDAVRSELYKLSSFDYLAKKIDIGNIKIGSTPRDTYFALSRVVTFLLMHDIIPIIIGGSNDLLYGQFMGYQEMEMDVNILHADAQLDMSFLQQEIKSNNFLTPIFTHSPNFLKHFQLLGFQSYLVDYNLQKVLSQMNFDAVRLGALQEDYKEMEPYVRDADIFSIDMSVVRMSEAPGNGNASPNGLFGNEICALARYAGMSDKVSSFGLYELNPTVDNRNQTSQLVAQIIWYFMDGVLNRVGDYPIISEKDFLKYTVHFQSENQNVDFYKSRKSSRWWMKVPKGDKGLHQMVPCSYSDYEAAANFERYPEKWLKTAE